MIRTAKMADVDCVLKLINNYAEKGLMLPRSPFDIYRKLTSFVVYETDGKIIGAYTLTQNLRTILPYKPSVEFENSDIVKNDEISFGYKKYQDLVLSELQKINN